MKYNKGRQTSHSMKHRLGGETMRAKTLLRLTRELRNETITSMAKELKIGISRYYMIETGDRPATPELAKRISEILKVKQDDIFLPQTFTAREIEHSKSTA